MYEKCLGAQLFKAEDSKNYWIQPCELEIIIEVLLDLIC